MKSNITEMKSATGENELKQNITKQQQRKGRFSKTEIEHENKTPKKSATGKGEIEPSFIQRP